MTVCRGTLRGRAGRQPAKRPRVVFGSKIWVVFEDLPHRSGSSPDVANEQQGISALL